MRTGWMLACLAALCAAGARAERVEQRHCVAPPGVTLRIENAAGLVEVVDWDREEVALDARLGGGVAALHFDCADAQVRVRVEARQGIRNDSATLRLRAPRDAAVIIDTASADVVVRGLSGAKEIQSASGRVNVAADSAPLLRVRTVGGNIEVQGNAPETDLSTTSGLIALTGDARRLTLANVSGRLEARGAYGAVGATTVSGGVTIEGALGSADVKSVSGRVDVGTVGPGGDGYPTLRVRTMSGNVRATGQGLRELAMDSVSGRLDYQGGFGPAPRIDARSVSGAITLELDAPLDAALRADSQLGRVEANVPGAVRGRAPGAGAAVTAETGAGSARLQSQSGGIRVRVP